MCELDRELRLPQPAEPSGRDDLAERDRRVAATKRPSDPEQFVAAADEQRVRRQEHPGTRRQRCALRHGVCGHRREQRLRCREPGDVRLLGQECIWHYPPFARSNRCRKGSALVLIQAQRRCQIANRIRVGVLAFSPLVSADCSRADSGALGQLLLSQA